MKIIYGILLSAILIFGFSTKKNGKTKIELQTNDDYKFLAVNECFLWLSNNGDNSFDPRTGGSGFYWPGGRAAELTAKFESGVLFGAKTTDPNTGQAIKVCGSTYRHGMQAGKILNDGKPDNAGNAEYRIYHIKRNWESLPSGEEKDALRKDYDEWPVEDGAPWIDVDNDGIFTRGIDTPEFVGDETLWWVMNDMDTSRAVYLYGSEPMGIEMQVTAYAFEDVDIRRNAVFYKYKIINKSKYDLLDSYVCYWTDDDLGDAEDDYVGCDTTLHLGYTFNADDDDRGFYEDKPPAIGTTFLQTPIIDGDAGDSAFYEGKFLHGKRNLGMTAFNILLKTTAGFGDPPLGEYEGSIQFYNLMQGLNQWGGEWIDPATGQTTKFILAGDPVNGAGWYEGDGSGYPSMYPGDRRYAMAAGPFDLRAGDTAIVDFAYVISQGNNRLESVRLLKQDVENIRKFYYNKSLPDFENEKISQEVVPLDASVNIYWSSEPENTRFTDFNYRGSVSAAPDYKFEGYAVYQYEDERGGNPEIIYLCDLKNDFSRINDWRYDNGGLFETNLFVTPNEGLVNYFTINKDYINGTELVNEREYYFGVRGFVYSDSSKPRTYFTKPEIMTVIPRKNQIDYKQEYSVNETVLFDRIKGKGDGYAALKIIDPSKLNDYEYKVTFEGEMDSLLFNLINTTAADTLIAHSDKIPSIRKRYNSFNYQLYINGNDTLNSGVIDGFSFHIRNIGLDSLKFYNAKYRVKEIYETNGPQGVEIDPPLPVWKHPNSTGEFYIESYGKEYGGGSQPAFIWQANYYSQGLGFTDYEIRFGDSSYYYYSGYQNSLNPPINKDDRLAEGKVPFSVWDLGESDSDTDDVRLMIKILDNSYQPERAIPDSQWTQFPNGSWEEIYAYKSEFDPVNPPVTSGISDYTDHRFGKFIIVGSIPQNGTILKLVTYKPLSSSDEFTIQLSKSDFNNIQTGKENKDKISVFPNPCFVNSVNADEQSNNIIFTNLPNKVIIRIYSLGGVFVKRLEKDDDSERLSWDLRNKSGEYVGSGVYLAYVEMPDIGAEVFKIGVIF